MKCCAWSRAPVRLPTRSARSAPAQWPVLAFRPHYSLFDMKERKLIEPTPEWKKAVGFAGSPARCRPAPFRYLSWFHGRDDPPVAHGSSLLDLLEPRLREHRRDLDTRVFASFVVQDRHHHVDGGGGERPGSVVVEEDPMSDDATLRRQAPEALVRQLQASLAGKAVMDERVEMKVALGERILPIVTSDRVDAPRAPVRGDVLARDFADRREIEDARLQLGPTERGADGMRAGAAADVQHSPVRREVDAVGPMQRGTDTVAVHPPGECRRALRVTVMDGPQPRRISDRARSRRLSFGGLREIGQRSEEHTS